MSSSLSDIIAALMGGKPVVIAPAPKRVDFSRLNPAESALAESLISVASKFGTFDESGCGIYAAYESGATNEDQNIGVKCENCVMYLGGDKCRIVNLPGKVEATGKCRFAVIPDGVVQAENQ